MARALPAFGRTAQDWRTILSASIKRGDTAMIENKLIAYYAGIERYAKARDVSPERLPHIRAVMEETLAAIGMLRDRAKAGAKPQLSEEERDIHIARVTSTCLELVDGYLGLPASQMHFMHSGVRLGQLGRLASTVGGVVSIGAWGGMMLEGFAPPALAITMMAGSTLNAFYHGLLRYSFRRGFDYGNSDVVRSLVHGSYTLSSVGTIASALTHAPSVAGAVSVGGSAIYLMSTLKEVAPNFMPGVLRAGAGLTVLAETTALISAWVNSVQGAQPRSRISRRSRPGRHSHRPIRRSFRRLLSCRRHRSLTWCPQSRTMCWPGNRSRASCVTRRTAARSWSARRIGNCRS